MVSPLAKLTGKKKAAFLARMAKGREKKKEKSQPKQRKTAKVKSNKNSTKSNNMAKRKSAKKSTSRRSKVTGIFNNPTLRKVFMGAGAAAVTTTVVNQVAPQYAQLAGAGAAFITGGPIGAAVALFMNGGLGQITGLGTGGGQSNGGLSV